MHESINRLAVSATLHCLTGCAIGEVLGMIISSLLQWSAGPSIVLSVTLAFLFGYSFSMFPLLRNKIKLRHAIKLALVADTVSILIMEITDNAFILAVPGAIHASLSSWLFWISLFMSLVAAFCAALPVNRWLIGRGKGHAVMHGHH